VLQGIWGVLFSFGFPQPSDIISKQQKEDQTSSYFTFDDPPVSTVGWLIVDACVVDRKGVHITKKLVSK
jgi:hypothetical protein